MKNFTELTKLGDPQINVNIPKILINILLDLAKANKRRPQDEIIKRLAHTLRNSENYSVIEQSLKPQLVKIFH